MTALSLVGTDDPDRDMTPPTAQDMADYDEWRDSPEGIAHAAQDGHPTEDEVELADLDWHNGDEL